MGHDCFMRTIHSIFRQMPSQRILQNLVRRLSASPQEKFWAQMDAKWQMSGSFNASDGAWKLQPLEYDVNGFTKAMTWSMEGKSEGMSVASFGHFLPITPEALVRSSLHSC